MQYDVQVETSIGGVCLPNPPLGTKFSQSPICDSFAPSCPASSSHHDFQHTQLLTQLVFDEVPVLTTLSLSLKQFAVKALNRITKIRFASVDLTKTIDRHLYQLCQQQGKSHYRHGMPTEMQISFFPEQFTVWVPNATLDLAALVLVGVVGFLGSEVVLFPVVSHCLRLSPFMWGVGVGWCGRFLGL